MTPKLLRTVLHSVLERIGPGVPVPADVFHELTVLLPENLVLAALDIVDRGNVFRYTTSWGREFYQVVGSRATYSVQPHLDISSTIPFYCVCPAFAYAVVLSESYILCKHVFAVLLAQRLRACIERCIDFNDMSSVLSPQVP